MDIIAKTFSIIPGFFPANSINHAPARNRSSSFLGLGTDWAAIGGIVAQVAGYVIKWCSGSGKGKSSWSQFDDATKENFVADGLKEAYRMAFAGELGTSGRVLDAFAAIVSHVDNGSWETFYDANIDWLPNRIAAAEKLYGHPFNSKPSEWVTTKPKPTTDPLKPLSPIQASFGSYGIIGIIALVGIGAFMLYDAVKKDKHLPGKDTNYQPRPELKALKEFNSDNKEVNTNTEKSLGEIDPQLINRKLRKQKSSG